MNKRIKELALQCNEEVGDYQYGSIPSFNYEKFAELIVKECRDMFVVDGPSWNLLNEKLEHFGDEE